MNTIKNSKNMLGVSFVVFVLTAFSTFANAQSNQNGQQGQGMPPGMAMPQGQPMQQMQPGQTEQGQQGQMGDRGPMGSSSANMRGFRDGNASSSMYRRMPMPNSINGYGSSTASTSRWVGRMLNGSSSMMRGGMDMNGSSTVQVMGMGGGKIMSGVFGTVTDVESSYILLDGRGVNGASTTFTVNFTASTTYSNGTTTASLADITVGSMIFANGPIATSTNTVNANHISLNAVIPSRFGYPNGSSTPGMNNGQGQQGQGGPGMNQPPQGQNGSLTANTASSSGFIGKVLHKLFGWL